MTTLPPNTVNPVDAPIVVWGGISARTYRFQIHPIGVAYYDRPGVYIFCKRAVNGNWDAVYIGETDSFERRLTQCLAQHHQWASIRACGATHICTLHVPGGLALREGIETDIRRLIKTPCNLQ